MSNSSGTLIGPMIPAKKSGHASATSRISTDVSWFVLANMLASMSEVHPRADTPLLCGLDNTCPVPNMTSTLNI